MKRGHIILIISVLSLIGIGLLIYWYKHKKATEAAKTTDTTTTPFDFKAFLAGKWGFQYDFQGAKGNENATVTGTSYAIDGVPVYTLTDIKYDEPTKTITFHKVRISNGEVLPDEVLVVDSVKKTMTGKQGFTNVVYTKIA